MTVKVPAPEPGIGAMDTASPSTIDSKETTTLRADIPWPTPLIVLPNVTIRPYHPIDAPSMARNANSKLVARNMTDRFPHPYALTDATAFISRALSPSTSNTYAWCISLTPTSPCIGGCGFEPGPDVFCANAEIGYWLGEEYWGRGIGTTVCRVMTDWAFGREEGVTGKQRVQRLGAGVFGGNPASGAVLKRSGYTYEGCMRGIVLKWGEIRDLEIYGLKREEWEERRKRSGSAMEMKLRYER